MDDQEQVENTRNPADPSEPVAATPEMLSQVRELILKAHPDVVPEMVAGETFDTLIASLEPARAAYQRVVEGVGVGVELASPPVPPAPIVPAGQPGRQFAMNSEDLSASAKIAEGLRQRNAGS